MSGLRVGIPSGFLQECAGFKQHENCISQAESSYTRYINGLIELILSDCLGANINLSIISDEGNGQGFSVENSTGVVKGILELKADVSNGDLDMTYDRSLVISFGPVLAYSTRVIMVNRRFAHHIHKLNYLGTFKLECLILWIALLSFMWVWNLLLPRCRHIEVQLMSCFLIFSAIFNRRLINTRSFSVSSLPFTSLQDAAGAIRNHLYHLIGPPGSGDGSQQEILTSTIFPATTRIKNQPSIPVIQAETGKYIVENPRYFTYYDKLFATAMVLRHKSELRLMKNRQSMLVMQGFGYNRKNITFGARLVKATLLVTEAGLLDALRRRSNAIGIARYYVESEGTVSVSSADHLAIQLSDLSNTFIAAGVGMAATIVVFAVELYAISL